MIPITGRTCQSALLAEEELKRGKSKRKERRKEKGCSTLVACGSEPYKSPFPLTNTLPPPSSKLLPIPTGLSNKATKKNDKEKKSCTVVLCFPHPVLEKIHMDNPKMPPLCPVHFSRCHCPQLRHGFDGRASHPQLLTTCRQTERPDQTNPALTATESPDAGIRPLLCRKIPFRFVHALCPPVCCLPVFDPNFNPWSGLPCSIVKKGVRVGQSI